MIRTWLYTLVKKALSGKVIQHAPRQARRCSFRPRLEALEDRLVTSISDVGPAWPSIPVAGANSAAAIASHGAATPLPSPTAPAGDAGAGYGTPGWEGLLRDVLEPGAPGPAAAPKTAPPPLDLRPVVPPLVTLSTKASSLPDTGGPDDVGMAQRPGDLSFVPPPSANRAESRVAQPPLPEPAARTAGVGPAQEPDRSNGASTVQAPRHDGSPTPSPQRREGESALANAATPLVDDRVPTRNRGTASIPAKAEPERWRAHVADDVLLRRYVTNGDQAAFRMLVREHERVVLGTCQRVLGDPHLAQEAFQITFMVLARKAAVLDGRR